MRIDKTTKKLLPITEPAARAAAAEYLSRGGAQHFYFRGKRITAFTFRRDVLKPLLEIDFSELFLMLVLTGDKRTPSKEHLDLVIGPRVEDYVLMDKLIISVDPPYTDSVTFAEDSALKGFGKAITPEELERMHGIFLLTITDDILYSTHRYDKIRGYTLGLNDLTLLALREEIDNSNEDDLYLFIPVVRPVNPQINSPFDRDYLSIAVARMGADGKVISYITEYCLPCPSACPSNF